MSQPSPTPNRSSTHERRRLLALIVIVCTLLMMEISLSLPLRDAAAFRIKSELNENNWPTRWFEDDMDVVRPPAKAPGVKRVLYLSNSHALTGGRVSRHMQSMLDQIAPNGFEVLDLSRGGLFTPEMHQRAVAAEDLQPDVVFLAFSYIAFSDRMGLARQAHTARNFLKANVAPRLDLGFWARNYDLGLFANQAVSRASILYRIREKTRINLEQSLSGMVPEWANASQSLALKMDTRKGWKFPQGYDRNLFQWRLYAAGRDDQLAELDNMISRYKEAGIPVLAQNLPIDWDKAAFPHNAQDLDLYRSELKVALQSTDNYQDLQGKFPVRLTSYDPLHPNWHGARLHAFFNLLQLYDSKLLPPDVTPESLQQAFANTGWQRAIDPRELHSAGARELAEFSRLDITETANAEKLLRRLLSLTPGSTRHWALNFRLTRAIALVKRFTPPDPNLADARLDAAWQVEKTRMSERINHFEKAFRSVLRAQLTNFPKTSGPTASLLNKANYQGAPIALLMRRNDGTIYMLFDLFGDGSFLGIAPPNSLVPRPFKYWSDDYTKRLSLMCGVSPSGEGHSCVNFQI